MEMFMNKKGKVVGDLSDEKWLWTLALLSDTRYLFLICLGLLEILERSWNYFGNSLKMLSCVIFLPVTGFMRLDQ